MDINGNVRSLALWEPELDVGQLVQAVASGLSLSSALNDLYTILPNYRFIFLFGKAMELCNELKSQCKEFLSLKEKRDGEVLQLMRTSHEMVVNGLVMELKKKQLEDAQKNLDSLKLSRKVGITSLYLNISSLIGDSLRSIGLCTMLALREQKQRR
jgi:hypothetical protein